MYPDKSVVLLEKWNTFQEAIEPILQAKCAKTSHKSAFEAMQAENNKGIYIRPVFTTVFFIS